MTQEPPRTQANCEGLPIVESPIDVPPPVLLNTWKHHAGALRQRIKEVGQAGAAVLQELPRHLLVIGSDLMDVYTGRFSPGEIAATIIAELRAKGRLSLDAYRDWLQATGGFGVITFPEDTSCWVLRMGNADRYVHVHPARRAPATRRVRANVLKTAVMVLAYVQVNGGEPTDVSLINAVRKQYLALAPIRGLSGAEGLAVVLEILQEART